jgi:hypothetical protein
MCEYIKLLRKSDKGCSLVLLVWVMISGLTIKSLLYLYIFDTVWCDKKDNYSFCLMVEAPDHGYVLHTKRIHVTRYRIRIQHQWLLAILNQFSVLIYAVCHILPSFVFYQGCVAHRWVFGVP